MNVETKIETLETNKMKLTFGVGPERFEEGMKHSYNKNKGKISIPGFRAGKVPRKMIEMQYGKEFLFEDAVNFVLSDAYEAAAKELDLNVVSRPEFDATSVSTEDGVVFTAEFYVKPDVTVSNYLGVTYSKVDTSATEEEINAEIMTAAEKNARIITISDRAVIDGDIVTIDYSGSADGVKFSGGEDFDHDITIGSSTFIPGFEEQIVGHNVSDTFDVNVTFPEEYHAEELIGKAAVFEVTIKEIKSKETPEINDEFAQDVSEYDTLDSYKASIRTTIEQSKISEANNKKDGEVVQACIDLAVMDVPEIMISNQVDNMVNDFASNLKRQGLPLDMYLQYMGQTMESIREAYKESATKQVKGRLVLEAIAKAENIEVSEDELNDELKEMSEAYKIDLEKFLEIVGVDEKNSIREDVKVRKALKIIVDAAIEM